MLFSLTHLDLNPVPLPGGFLRRHCKYFLVISSFQHFCLCSFLMHLALVGPSSVVGQRPQQGLTELLDRSGKKMFALVSGKDVTAANAWARRQEGTIRECIYMNNRWIVYSRWLTWQMVQNEKMLVHFSPTKQRKSISVVKKCKIVVFVVIISRILLSPPPKKKKRVKPRKLNLILFVQTYLPKAIVTPATAASERTRRMTKYRKTERRLSWSWHEWKKQ